MALKCCDKQRMKKAGCRPEDVRREIRTLYAAKGCLFITQLYADFEDDRQKKTKS